MSPTSREQIRSHWNQRAALGERAGTQDLLAKQLERQALQEACGAFWHDYPLRHVLEIGCGRGDTARELAMTLPDVQFLALDNAAAMIAAARTEGVGHNLQFEVGDVAALPDVQFDLIYTQRMLINLTTWEEQRLALDTIADRLLPGGQYLMCENSQDGVDAINVERLKLGLEPIERPWHNRYLRDAELFDVTSLRLLRCVPFSSTYYFLSRVVNAALAHDEGLPPRYDARINQLALQLPSVGPWAQGRLWIWEKP